MKFTRVIKYTKDYEDGSAICFIPCTEETVMQELIWLMENKDVSKIKIIRVDWTVEGKGMISLYIHRKSMKLIPAEEYDVMTCDMAWAWID